LYNFLKNSGSKYREIIGTEWYDNNWNYVLNELSGSSSFPVYSSSAQLTYADEWMRASGSTLQLFIGNQNG